MPSKRSPKKRAGQPPKSEKLTPAARARAWWGARAKAGSYVIPPTESPSPAVTKVLRHEGLVIEVAGRRVWILVPSRPTNRRAVFLPNYWAVVSLVLNRYKPA